ncbi:hypothetical protein BC628DRAFT_817541 [Trametes gibbosa]|nr:hypothetical protein BC628DRAFT_817541 [Trametes gibbosa]
MSSTVEYRVGGRLGSEAVAVLDISVEGSGGEGGSPSLSCSRSHARFHCMQHAQAAGVPQSGCCRCSCPGGEDTVRERMRKWDHGLRYRWPSQTPSFSSTALKAVGQCQPQCACGYALLRASLCRARTRQWRVQRDKRRLQGERVGTRELPEAHYPRPRS